MAVTYTFNVEAGLPASKRWCTKLGCLHHEEKISQTCRCSSHADDSMNNSRFAYSSRVGPRSQTQSCRRAGPGFQVPCRPSETTDPSGTEAATVYPPIVSEVWETKVWLAIVVLRGAPCSCTGRSCVKPPSDPCCWLATVCVSLWKTESWRVFTVKGDTLKPKWTHWFVLIFIKDIDMMSFQTCCQLCTVLRNP